MAATDPDREDEMPAAMPDQALSPPAYRIESTDDEMVIRIPRGSIPDEQISRFFDLVAQEVIRQKSQLTEEDATQLADEIDQAVWQGVRREVFGEE